MKHTSPLQQLHLLLTSSQSGHVRSHTCLLETTGTDFIDFNLNDSCASEPFSEEGKSPNSEMKLSVSLTNSPVSHYQRLPDLGSPYVHSDSHGSVRKEHSLPTLHPLYQRTGTSTEDSPTYSNSVETVPSSVSAIDDRLELRTHPTTIATVLEERLAIKTELEQKRKRSGFQFDRTVTLTDSRKVHHTSISPSRSTKKHSTCVKSLEIVDNTDQGHDLLESRCPMTITGPIKKDMNKETGRYSDPEIESVHVSGMKQCTRHIPLGVDDTVEVTSNIPREVSESDSAEWKTDKDSAGLQSCDTTSAELINAVSEAPRSLVPTPSSSSTRHRRQRQIEVEQVHQVYKQIAPYCDHVRQKAWPRVKRFLKEVEPGSLVADVGCGNGRYLNINASVFKLGCDTCPPFLDQARGQNHEVVTADNIALPYRDATFDAVISIGVIHHFASLERRIRALSELSRILAPGGRLMVYVWAFEQIHRKFESQDVLIPWVKPEVKDFTGRNTSCSTQPGSNNFNSMGGSTVVDDSAMHSFRSRRRYERYKSFHPAGDRCRSKSLGDKESTTDDYSDQSISDDYIENKKFGVFDRRDNIKRDFKFNRKDDAQNENTVLEGMTEYEGHGKSCNGELKTGSKWPGQLVSECRKLGKILRSLSSRSDSQSNGDGDPLSGVDEKVADVIDDLGQRYNSNTCGDILVEDTKDTNNELSTTKLINEYCETKVGASVTIKDTDQHETDQDICFLCGENTESTRITSHITTSRLTITTLSGSSSDTYDRNHSALSNTVPTCHTVQTTSTLTTQTKASEVGTQNSGKCNVSSFIQKEPKGHSILVSNLKETNDIEKLELDSIPNCPQYPISEARSSSSDESLGTSSISQESNSSCSHDRTESSSREDLKPSSNSWITVSTLENATTRDSVPSHMDETVTDIQYDCKKNSSRELGVPRTQSTKAGYGPNGNKFLENMLETAPGHYISHEANYKMTSMGDFNNGVLKCQHYLAMIGSNCDSPVHGPPEGEPINPIASCSNTSTDVNYGISDQDDNTDCLNSDSIFSLQDKSVNPFSEYSQSSEAYSRDHPGKSNNIALCQGACAGDKMETDFEHIRDSDFENDSVTKNDTLHTPCNGSRNEQCDGKALPQDRVTFKTFLHKLADYVRLPSRNEPRQFGCYHNGKSPGGDCTIEADSSENDTPISSFSTHSSCYPGLFAVSKEKACSEKKDISDKQKRRVKNCIDEDTFQGIGDAQESINSDTLASGDRCKSLRINTLESKQTSIQNFVSDVSEAVPNTDKDTHKSSSSFPYKFQVENLSLAPVKRNTFLHVLTKKLSNLFTKESLTVPKQSYLRYSTVSLSPSDGNEEILNISLEANEQPSTSENTPPNRIFTRRPTFLDFSKKRTRGKGRRPAPRKDKEFCAQNIKEYKMQNRENRIQDERQLTLSDAMTLLGDGAAEESVVKRLDDSAKSIFAQMKRMNFAIRKFPMSSVDSDNSEDVIIESVENSVETDTAMLAGEAERTKLESLKMRRDKRIFSSHRRFSDSVTSKVIASRRRGPLQRQREIDNRNIIKKVLPLQREYLSEDLVNFLDSFGIQRCRRESQLLLLRSQDSKPDLFTPLESPPKSLQRASGLQNQSNNALLSTDDSENEKMTGSCQPEMPLPIKVTEKVTDSTVSETVERNLMKHNTINDYDAPGSLCTTLNYSSNLCDSDTINIDNITSTSADNVKIDQSYLENETAVARYTSSPLASCNQLEPKAPALESLKHSSSYENAEAKSHVDDQSEHAGTKNSSLSRYYHVFKKGELDQLVTRHVPSLNIVDTFYDHANWCIIAEKV